MTEKLREILANVRDKQDERTDHAKKIDRVLEAEEIDITDPEEAKKWLENPDEYDLASKNDSPSSDIGVKCTECAEKFDTERAMKIHRTQVHGETEDEDTEEDTEDETEDETEDTDESEIDRMWREIKYPSDPDPAVAAFELSEDVQNSDTVTETAETPTLEQIIAESDQPYHKWAPVIESIKTEDVDSTGLLTKDPDVKEVVKYARKVIEKLETPRARSWNKPIEYKRGGTFVPTTHQLLNALSQHGIDHIKHDETIVLDVDKDPDDVRVVLYTHTTSHPYDTHTLSEIVEDDVIGRVSNSTHQRKLRAQTDIDPERLLQLYDIIPSRHLALIKTVKTPHGTIHRSDEAVSESDQNNTLTRMIKQVKGEYTQGDGLNPTDVIDKAEITQEGDDVFDEAEIKFKMNPDGTYRQKDVQIDNVKDGKTWVAYIKGSSEEYTFNREFIAYRSEQNTSDEPTVEHFTPEDGDVIEEAWRRPNDRDENYYLYDDEQFYPLSKQEVLELTGTYPSIFTNV